MRVYVGVQSTPSGGASSLSSYIAKSKVDREREQLTENGSRPLFSADKDSLTLKEADHVLNPTERELQKDELIHVVVSPEPGTLDRAGDDPAEKHKAIRQAIRGTLRVMAEVVNVKNLFWIAGLHENTKTPHVHVAISRWALDAVTNKLRYIKHLPKSLLPHNTEDAAGERRLLTGKIAETFTSSFVRLLKPIRSVQLRDAQNNINVSRSVLSRFAQILQQPTHDQVTVGKWLETALMLATGRTGQLSRDELLQQHSQLTAKVAKIDASARANGMRPPAAFIPAERLEALVNAKTGNVQITVSSTELKPSEELSLAGNPTETIVPSIGAETKTQPVEKLTENSSRGEFQSPKAIDVKQPEKLTPSRASNPERQERPQPMHKEDLKAQQPVKETPVKPQEPLQVAKLTLFELRDQIHGGNLTLPLTEIMSSTEKSNAIVVTKTSDSESQVAAPAPTQSTPQTHEVVSKVPQDTNTHVEDHSLSDHHEEPQEWEIDDDTVRRLAGVAFYNLNERLHDREMGEASIHSVLIRNDHYFPPHVTSRDAPFREAQIAVAICQNACLERELTPDIEGAKNYFIGQLRLNHGRIVPVMEQMNNVRDYLEELTTSSNQHLFHEYERLHALYPDLRPNIEHEVLYGTYERSFTRTEQTREREHEREQEMSNDR